MTNVTEDKIVQIREAITQYNIDSASQLEQFRIHYLGSKNQIKDLFNEIRNIPNEDRKAFGQLVNELKILAEEKFTAHSNLFEKTTSKSNESEDFFLPAFELPEGSLHPITLVKNKILDIFSNIGFSVAEGPEIENDWHNFTALNLAKDHPARDMQDTFYLQDNPEWLLRTHTSSVQVREMEKGELPLRKMFPGRVYRNETISARAHCFFHQIEGLYIADNVSFADLKQTLFYFCKEMFGENTQLRFRPSYFPFTEPSAELDVSCFICDSKGCNVCKHTGWVEILGCGMVHANVLNNVGIDPDKYTGFAFGMGIERITMLKFGINDLRLFSENDVRFLEQFSGLQL